MKKKKRGPLVHLGFRVSRASRMKRVGECEKKCKMCGEAENDFFTLVCFLIIMSTYYYTRSIFPSSKPCFFHAE